MLLSHDTFPFTPLEDDRKRAVGLYCDGIPLQNRERFREFLRKVGQPALGHAGFWYVFDEMGWSVVCTLGVPKPEALRAFNRGLLFYAAVFHVATGEKIEDLHPDVFLSARGNESDWLAQESVESAHEIPSVTQLVSEGRHAMDTAYSDKLYLALQAGAGSLHSMVVQSDAINQETTASFLQQFPDLADLADRTN